MRIAVRKGLPGLKSDVSIIDTYIGSQLAPSRILRAAHQFVTPEGLNVFPDDVERALNAQPGVVESAVVGSGRRRPGARPRGAGARSGRRAEAVVRGANAQLADHQRIRSFSIWTDGPLPRTEGTKKLKRAAIGQWVDVRRAPAARRQADDPLQALLAQFAGGRAASTATRRSRSWG